MYLIVILRACVDPLHFRMQPRQKQWSQWPTNNTANMDQVVARIRSHQAHLVCQIFCLREILYREQLPYICRKSFPHSYTYVHKNGKVARLRRTNSITSVWQTLAPFPVRVTWRTLCDELMRVWVVLKNGSLQTKGWRDDVWPFLCSGSKGLRHSLPHISHRSPWVYSQL